MSFFANTQELEMVMKGLWTSIKEDPSIADPLIKSGLVVRFHYREPEGRLTVDCSDNQTMFITWGECEIKPDVEMFMKSEVAHEFWRGAVSVPMYLIAGKIVAKGPVNKALSLLPAIKPAFKKYPDVVQQTLNRTLVSK